MNKEEIKNIVSRLKEMRPTMDNLAGDFEIGWFNKVITSEKGFRKLGYIRAIDDVIDLLNKIFK